MRQSIGLQPRNLIGAATLFVAKAPSTLNEPAIHLGG
tara:strand:- start:326 stop:436 length:111 start_codon:yes stop_codon:yes gene_type:complete